MAEQDSCVDDGLRGREDCLWCLYLEVFDQTEYLLDVSSLDAFEL